MAKRTVPSGPRRVFGLYGATGTGKTLSLGTFCAAGLRVRVQDADGQAHLRLAPWIKKGMCVVEPWSSFEQVAVLYSALINEKDLGVDVVAWDTVSIANEEFVREDPTGKNLGARTKKEFQSPDWGDRKPAAEMIGSLLMWGKKMADPNYVKHPVHVVYMMHEDIRMIGPSGAKEGDKVERVATRGPALPGRFIHRGGAFMQELYHIIVVKDEEDPAQLNRWFVTQNDGEWPAKGDAKLAMFEEPDFGAILAKLDAA